MIWIISLAMCLILAIAFLAVYNQGWLSVVFADRSRKSKDPAHFVKLIHGSK